MLKQIRIENFKNISDTIINFNSNLSGIYGPNGSGKTSIIELFTMFQDNLLAYERDNEANDVSEIIRGETFEKQIIKYIKNGTDKLSYTFEFEENDFTFQFYKKYNLNQENKTEITYEEVISYKRTKTRAMYKELYRKTLNQEDDFSKYQFLGETCYFKQNISNIKKTISPYSLFSDALDETKNKKQIELITSVKRVLQNIQNAHIFTLSDQSNSNLGLAIPITIHEKLEGSDIVGKLPIFQWDHYYQDFELKIIMHAIDSISELLSSLVPGKQLCCEVFKEKLDDDNNLISAITLYTVTNNEKVNISYESTGIIKLISLISTFNEVVSSKNAIVLIDELDAHIFEFLLSKTIKVIEQLIKGQLIFTAHNLTLFEMLNKNNIILSYSDEVGNIQFSEFPKVNKTENMRNKYIRLQALSDNEKIMSADISENLIYSALYNTSMRAFLEMELV